MRRRPTRWVIAACVVALLGNAGAVGTIITDGATIRAGTGSPQGVVTIDPCAPEADPPPRPQLGTLTTQGTITGALPAKPSTGSGALGNVTISTDTFLPSGTYEYGDFEIDSNATVTYGGGPTTILATGYVWIEGRIETFSTGESVTIIAGDDLSIFRRNGDPVTGIVTQGSGAAIRLEADTVQCGVTFRGPGSTTPTGILSALDAAAAGVTVRAHSVAVPGLGIDVQDTFLRAGNGPLTLQAGNTIWISEVGDAQTIADGGNLLCQAFADLVWLNGGTLRVADAAGGLVEAQGDVLVANGFELSVARGDLRLESFGGDVVLEDSSSVSADDGVTIGEPSGTGEIIVAAANSVLLRGASEIESDGTGGIRVTAHGGDVIVEEPGSPAGSSIACLREAGILVEAAGDVQLHGTSGLESRSAPLVVRAHGGEVRMRDGPILSSVSSDVDVRAASGIVLRSGPESSESVISGTPRSISGESVLLVAGADGIEIGGYLTARSGFLTLHSQGDIELDGSARSGGGQGLTFLTEDGSINVYEATVVGGATTADESGDVLLESFGGSSATIDTTDAFIASDDVNGESGDVSLIIHSSGAIESFVLPKTVKVKVNAKKPTKSSLVAAGFFDTGPEAADLTGPATISVGGLEIEADLQAKKPFLFKSGSDGFKLQIKTARSGSSKARFRLQVKNDLMGEVPTDGELTLRFATAGANGLGTVVLEKGAYRLGRKMGTLIAPNVLPFQLKQKHRGPGRDTFLLKAGIVTEGGTPQQAPEVSVALVGSFDFAVPGDQFELQGGKFVAKRPPAAPDVDLIQIDFAKEQLVIKARNLDLGAIGGARPATIQIGLDDDIRAVSVRLSPKSKTILKY